jgi:WD40 repeat protein
VSFRRIVQERRAAEQGRLEAQQARLEAEARGNDLVLSQARMLLDRDPTGALAWLKLYPTDAPRWGVARNIASDARRRGFATRVLGAHKSHVRAARFSPDGLKVVSAGMDKLVVVWDLRDGSSRAVPIHTEGVHDVRFSPDGQWIASAGEDAVRLWQGVAETKSRVGCSSTSRVPY